PVDPTNLLERLVRCQSGGGQVKAELSHRLHRFRQSGSNRGGGLIQVRRYIAKAFVLFRLWSEAESDPCLRNRLSCLDHGGNRNPQLLLKLVVFLPSNSALRQERLGALVIGTGT